MHLLMFDSVSHPPPYAIASAANSLGMESDCTYLMDVNPVRGIDQPLKIRRRADARKHAHSIEDWELKRLRKTSDLCCACLLTPVRHFMNGHRHQY